MCIPIVLRDSSRSRTASAKKVGISGYFSFLLEDIASSENILLPSTPTKTAKAFGRGPRLRSTLIDMTPWCLHFWRTPPPLAQLILQSDFHFETACAFPFASGEIACALVRALACEGSDGPSWLSSLPRSEAPQFPISTHLESFARMRETPITPVASDSPGGVSCKGAC